MAASKFQRYLLPGLAFKAVVIGGGYATGREIVEFFLPSGPQGGLLAMVVSMGIWSVICALTFVFALQIGAYDYRTFFKSLLGKAWPVFEVANFLSTIVMLSVYGAAAGAIAASFGLPMLSGTLAFVSLLVLFATFGNDAVEALFKYVSLLLYGTYAVFMILAFPIFGSRIADAFAKPVPMDGWLAGGLTYSGYNLIGAVLILPMLRHIATRREAVVAGLLSGPLAMVPAILFFLCMAAFYPAILDETLPSDYLLGQLNLPIFRTIFQLMIFAALVESGTGALHAINERIAHSGRGGDLPVKARFLSSTLVAIVAVFLAAQFGLVALIANGYRVIAYVFMAIYLGPLLTYGVLKIWQARNRASVSAPQATSPVPPL
jgi:uncharacterized membrane protein YkvI